MDWIDISPSGFTSSFEYVYKMFAVACFIVGNVHVINMGRIKISELGGRGQNQDIKHDYSTLFIRACLIWMVLPLFYGLNTEFGFTVNPLRIFLSASTDSLSGVSEWVWLVCAIFTTMIFVFMGKLVFSDTTLLKKFCMISIAVIMCNAIAQIFDTLT